MKEAEEEVSKVFDDYQKDVSNHCIKYWKQK